MSERRQPAGSVFGVQVLTATLVISLLIAVGMLVYHEIFITTLLGTPFAIFYLAAFISAFLGYAVFAARFRGSTIGLVINTFLATIYLWFFFAIGLGLQGVDVRTILQTQPLSGDTLLFITLFIVGGFFVRLLRRR